MQFPEMGIRGFNFWSLISRGRARAIAFRFVFVRRIEVDGAEGFKNAPLAAKFYILFERGGDGFFLGAMSPGATGGLDQSVVQCEADRHRQTIAHGDG